MIIWKGGNILLDDAQVLVSPVNCVGVSGAGLAKRIAHAYPDAEASYVDLCRKGWLQLGETALFPASRIAGTVPEYILYFPTKQHWRDKSSLDSIARGIQHILENAPAAGLRSVAIPKLGCGLGGLCWEDVRPLFMAFKDTACVYHVYGEEE